MPGYKKVRFAEDVIKNQNSKVKNFIFRMYQYRLNIIVLCISTIVMMIFFKKYHHIMEIFFKKYHHIMETYNFKGNMFFKC